MAQHDWGVMRGSHAQQFNIKDMFRNLANGILDKSIPLCCITHFGVHEFLTGKVQASVRGLIIKPHYYRKNLGTGYTPCRIHALHS